MSQPLLFDINTGSGGGQVVSMLAFCSNDPSSNPAEADSFPVKFVLEKNENKQKEAGLAHKIHAMSPCC